MRPEFEEEWRELRRRLADVLSAMTEHEVLVLNTESGVGAPYVQALCWDTGVLRIETVSNAYLDEQFALDETREIALEELGWIAPTYVPGEEAEAGSANF